MIAALHDQIPFGHYCYGYIPAKDSGFKTVEEIHRYVATLPEDQQTSAHFRLQQVKYCPHWRRIEGGRVECTHLGVRAIIWGYEKEARKYYIDNPHEEGMDTGFLLGDAVKECYLNEGGVDFTIPC